MDISTLSLLADLPTPLFALLGGTATAAVLLCAWANGARDADVTDNAVGNAYQVYLEKMVDDERQIPGAYAAELDRQWAVQLALIGEIQNEMHRRSVVDSTRDTSSSDDQTSSPSHLHYDPFSDEVFVTYC